MGTKRCSAADGGGRRKACRREQEPKYSIEEIVSNQELVKTILMKSKMDRADVYATPELKHSPTAQNLLPHNAEQEVVRVKRNPLSRREKHSRAMQSLVLMDSILEQTERFTAKERIVDFSKVHLRSL